MKPTEKLNIHEIEKNNGQEPSFSQPLQPVSISLQNATDQSVFVKVIPYPNYTLSSISKYGTNHPFIETSFLN